MIKTCLHEATSVPWSQMGSGAGWLLGRGNKLASLTCLTPYNQLMSFGLLFLCALFPNALTDDGSFAFSASTCQKRDYGIVGAHHFCPRSRLLNPSDVHGCCA